MIGSFVYSCNSKAKAKSLRTFDVTAGTSPALAGPRVILGGLQWYLKAEKISSFKLLSALYSEGLLFRRLDCVLLLSRRKFPKPLHGVHEIEKIVVRKRTACLLLRVVDLPVVVLDQLVDETVVFFQHLPYNTADNCI